MSKQRICPTCLEPMVGGEPAKQKECNECTEHFANEAAMREDARRHGG